MAAERLYKVQRPITGSGPILIYTKGKKHPKQLYQTELGYHDVLAAMGDSIRCFFPGRVVDGKLTLKLALRVPRHKEPTW